MEIDLFRRQRLLNMLDIAVRNTASENKPRSCMFQVPRQAVEVLIDAPLAERCQDMCNSRIFVDAHE